MSHVAIRVEELGKQFRLGVHRPHDRFSELIQGLGKTAISGPKQWIGRQPSREQPGDTSTDFWALKDVSFELDQGEVLGIIGRNGAGKSTLLKILSRITEPTTGRFGIRGRVGSLLEVGTGFHPELTGRENIFLNGAILGMSRDEVQQKFDEIVEFAGIEQFLETPVKRYSSGMYVRLGFSVAAHLEPEILLVDEVLSVGDAAFQKKCLGKINSVAKGGRTIIFISHNILAVQGLCDRVLWLNDGRVRADGPARTVISEYLQAESSLRLERVWDDYEQAPGNNAVRLHRAEVVVPESEHTEITTQTTVELRFEFWNAVGETQLNPAVVLHNDQGIPVFSSTLLPEQVKPLPKGLIRSTCVIPGRLLNDGDYEVQLNVIRDSSSLEYRFDELLRFTVIDAAERPGGWFGKRIGVVRPHLDWSIAFVEQGLGASGRDELTTVDEHATHESPTGHITE